jgi:hypothetical protein
VVAEPQGSAVNCPAGILESVIARVTPTTGATDVAIAPLSSVQPEELQPLLNDACVIAYTGRNGLFFTYVFSLTANLPEIGDAARSAGYSGEDTPNEVDSLYLRDDGTVSGEVMSADPVFSKFFADGVILQTVSKTGP